MKIALIMALALLFGPARAGDEALSSTVPSSGQVVWFDSKGCTLARIVGTAEVTVDWRCVEEYAAQYQPHSLAGGINPSLALILKAVHDGTATEIK